MGIEPTSEAWEASILPLYDARSSVSDYTQGSQAPTGECVGFSQQSWLRRLTIAAALVSVLLSAFQRHFFIISLRWNFGTSANHHVDDRLWH
jgi:hypothetical protein